MGVKVMMVVRASIGGEFRHVRVLARELCDRGYEVALAGPHRPEQVDPRVSLYPIEMVRPLRLGPDLRAARELARAVRDFRPDLIHAHGSKGGALARIVKPAAPRIPVIYTAHRFGFADEVPGDSHGWLYRLIERAMAPLTAHYLCVCAAEADDAAMIGGAGKTTVAHNGIDPSFTADPDPRLGALEGPLLACVGELRLSKGIGTLIEAFATLRETLPAARLVIAGDGPDRAAIERAIAAAEQSEAIELLGHVNGVDSVLAAADLFVSASWAESFPYSILEAMAASLPIVATDVGGTAEAVHHDQNGLVVAPRDAAGLAAALLAVAADPARAGAMGSAGRALLLARFTEQQMIERSLEVFRSHGLRSPGEPAWDARLQPPTRVMMVVRAERGGEWRHVVRLAQQLPRHGVEVAICGPHGERSDALEATIFDVPMERAIRFGADLRAVRGVAGAIRSFRPDLVHAHGSKGGALARLARYAAPQIPVIYSPHQYAFANHFGRYEGFAYRSMERSLAPLTTRVIAVCADEATQAKRVISPAKVSTVHNGIIPLDSSPDPDPALAALDGAEPIIAVIAELHPRKGLLTLLDAVAAIRTAHPGSVIAIAGEGDQRAILEARIEAAGIGESVRLLGELGDVSGLLARARVVLNPAWAEAFPYAVLEAMSVGCPVVATAVGGVGEAIESGVNGVLIEAHDAAAMAAATIELLDNAEMAARIGSCAAQTVRERFTLDGMVEGTLVVYRALGVKSWAGAPMVS